MQTISETKNRIEVPAAELSPELVAYQKRQAEIAAGGHPEILAAFEEMYCSDKFTKEANYLAFVGKKS